MLRARDVLGPGSRLAETLPGYEDRPGQLAMAEAVEAALGGDRALFVEAGTGTGKTLAYLVPALLSGRKVVISTATKALQEQIFTKDLPLVAEVLAAHGVTFRAALMKGLSNYVCKRRLLEARLGASIDPHAVAIERWVLETETGDRAELAHVPDDAEAWRSVHSSTDTRIGASCPHYEECFVTQMKREAEGADLVVVNHHLFCADLALRHGRGGARGDVASAIPAYDAVVFDEAHQLEEIAVAFFGSRVSSARVEALVRDAHRAFVAADLIDGVVGRGEARVLLDLVEEAQRAFFGALQSDADKPGGRRPLVRRDFEGDVGKSYGRVKNALAALSGYATTHDTSEAVALVARRADDLVFDLARVVEGANEADARAEEYADVASPREVVAWLERRERSVSIGASPIDLGPTLREALFERVPAVVCTSATLATPASSARGVPSFDFVKARLGAPPDAEELVVPSPFDFAARALLYAPRDLPEPSDARFEERAIERVVELVELTGGGAFVLCTSVRVMRAFHARLTKRLKWPVLVQGHAPKHLLLARFRAAGDAVLVATMSFWEGVDVPGRALRLVVLDKIPFAVPTDPLVAARSSEIERQGGNAFAEYSVPQAALTLKQGFGRLIRTQSDAGIVAVLDRRLVTKGYGKALRAALPPARVTESLDDVRAFWHGLDAESAASAEDAVPATSAPV